jgi:fatty-acyl-CoA synthase
MSIYETHLERGPANHAALSPISFLQRAAAVYPDKLAVVHGAIRLTYAELGQRARRLASALARRDIAVGDAVSVLAPNVPPMLEAHYGVPLAGAVLNTLNFRQDAGTIAFCLAHSGAKALIVDREFSDLARAALARLEHRPLILVFNDPAAPPGESCEGIDYEEFLREGDPEFPWSLPQDEWQAIALNYTSGTTGDPKGVVYHHRGAHLNALSNVLAYGLDPTTVYLWTLPMFHCNGWSFTWALSAVAGRHLCLRKVDAAEIFRLIEAEGVTMLCGAPVVLNLLVNSASRDRRPLPHRVRVITGGAAPPSTIIAGMERMGFEVIHAYGLTECYGPSTTCVNQPEWLELPLEERALRMSRQGVANPMLAAQRVRDLATDAVVPADGSTIGELELRGNTVMKGYLKNARATADAFKGGWFRTGDLAVQLPDGYVEIKDRVKDIIISGGENISSLEIEEILYRHPGVLEAAVVARPDPKWGETPCAFVAFKTGATVSEAQIAAHCRANMAHFKVPKTFQFGPLPKTATGKIQKFILRERAKEL